MPGRGKCGVTQKRSSAPQEASKSPCPVLQDAGWTWISLAICVTSSCFAARSAR